ncbi:MAG: hypothetical protein IJZ25_00410 [Lachnospiraceae bacterium]|nr:hypothetical protein [Lachnospiraceae bacterium]
MKQNKTKDNSKNQVKQNDVNGFYYKVLPILFAVLALVCSFVRYVLVKFESGDIVFFKHNLAFTTFFDGNPNIIAILACTTMFLCFLVIPKSMMKKRKSGDGLGAMFMPLGLLGIFEVLCTIENKKDLEVGIIFGVCLFLVSAVATFKKTISWVKPMCGFMIIVSLFLILAGLMPYCYNKVPFVLSYEEDGLLVSTYFYVSYFLRDIFLLMSFGIFSDKLTKIYNNMEN